MDGRGYLSRTLGVTLLTIAALGPGCGSSPSSSAAPSQVTNGTIAGSVTGSTSQGTVTGAASGSITSAGAMSGTLSGTIHAVASSSSGVHASDVAPDVTFNGSIIGTHGGSGVTGSVRGTASNGATFTGTFSGDMVGMTGTYRASGSITFSGAVTGDVAVTLQGDCPPDLSGPNPTPVPQPTPTPTPTPTPVPAPTPPLPSQALIGSWSGSYTLNSVPGSMTWSITTAGADGNSGTYSGSLDLMRSGSLNLGALNPDNSLPITLRLTCTNQTSLVVFQGTAQLSGSSITGKAVSVGGGNCGDPTLATWTVSVAMTKN